MPASMLDSPGEEAAHEAARPAVGGISSIPASGIPASGIQVSGVPASGPSAGASIHTLWPATLPTLESLRLALQRHGCPAFVIERLLDGPSLGADRPGPALTRAFGRVLRFRALPRGRLPRPVMLIGPSGAGKTTVLAKLATRAVMEGARPAVLTLDTVRPGATEQLEGFTRLLDVALLALDTPEDALAAREELRSHPHILIDTPGRNPFDPNDMEEARAWIDLLGARPVLVLPAGLDPLEASEMAIAFAQIGAERMIVSRLDMARRFGGMLAAAIAADMALAEASLSSSVPDGLTMLDSGWLARRLLDLAPQLPDGRSWEPAFGARRAG